MNGYANEFAELKERLKSLEKRFNPDSLNLHFGAPRDAEVWPGLWGEIEVLAGEGLGLVTKHRKHFLTSEGPSAMYDDGMFFYELFLFIHAVDIAQTCSNNANDHPAVETVESILRSLIDISEYSAVVPGDIFKRNWEALADFLVGFPELAARAEEIAGPLEDGIRKNMILGAVRAAESHRKGNH